MPKIVKVKFGYIGELLPYPKFFHPPGIDRAYDLALKNGHPEYIDRLSRGQFVVPVEAKGNFFEKKWRLSIFFELIFCNFYQKVELLVIFLKKMKAKYFFSSLFFIENL